MRPVQKTMTAILLGVVACVAEPAAAADAFEKPEAAKVDGKIDWVYDYEQGKSLSRETGKPMFVVFRCER